ncbi:hypothetical protein GGI18_000836 [Coemansia linderi]|uniref:Uncharacterized protein n=1 Tax=Coemansia linderi TaxID=2663919 RepID=A0ACC1KLT0_9FUNG|nr:hypothetical protein GGI18_000836 [Coemansia linderi]
MTQTYAQFAAAFTSHHAGWYQKQLASVASFKAFYAALDSWKRSDAKKLILAMERHYLDLNQLWQSVQHQALGEGDKTWQAGIRGQQDDLLAKIRALGGDDAVEALTLSQREPQLSHSGTQSLPVPSHQPASGGSASDTLQVSPLPSAVLAKAMSDPVSREVNRVLGNFDLTASAALQDAKLAHELVLDPGLRLEPAASNTLVGAVQQAVTKAFFAHIKQGIDQGNNDHVLGILTQLRLDMHTIVPPSSHQRETLDRELDPEWIATQLSNGALDVHAKFRLILQTARSVCAPIRDDTIDSLLDRLTAVDFSALANIHKAMGALSNEAKSSVGELLEITQEIMQLVRNVRLDALNHQLDVTVRPWLRIHIVEYEQTKMAQLLESQCQSDAQLIVAKTTGWMHAAATRESSAPCSLPTTTKHVFLEAVLDMCFAPVALSEEDTPVTWTLDRLRIQQLQNELQVLLSASALCALTKALAQNSGVQADTSRQNALELVSLLREDGVTMDRIIGMVQRITGSEEIMTDLVPKTLAKDDPVFRLMERQLRKFMLAELDKNEAPGLLARRLESNSQAISAALSSFSMSAVHKEVVEVLIRASRLCSLNWQVYSPWYTKTRLA